jgi:hypothetical protein
MDEHPGTCHIFHIYRADGTPLFLHPFSQRGNAKQIGDLLERAELTGLYGAEPKVEALTSFRNELYDIVESEVRRWVSEERFTPQFLASAAAFLITYLLLSFLIRDGLPLIDELAVAMVVAIGSYLYLTKRNMKSEPAVKRRMTLRGRVDGIVFSESDFVKRIEQALQEQERESTESLLRSFDWYVEADFARNYEETARQIVQYLESRFSDRGSRRMAKRLMRRERISEREREIATLKKWAHSKRIDLPLFALYVQLKKSLYATRDVAAES